jgi:hypothetical protein
MDFRNAAAADLPRGRAFSRRRGGWRPPVPALFSFDHLVLAGEQRRRHFEAERLAVLSLPLESR